MAAINQVLLGVSASLPVGEVTLTNTSGTWVCPAGVTSVCAVLVGEGGSVSVSVANSGNRVGGGGGALAYKNSITVVPGTSYTYTFSSGTSGGVTMFGIIANNGKDAVTKERSNGGTASGGTANFSGGGSDYSSSSVVIGGNAATYTANGADMGNTGIGLLGTGSSGDYGRGANAVYGTGVNEYGGPAAIRIIWGPGRSFPSNAT